MRSWLSLVVLAMVAAACEQLAGARINLVFENETKTKCVGASAKRAGGATVNLVPASLNRAIGDDLIVIGLSENRDLTGEVAVTVKRFTTTDCAGTEFASETKQVTLVRGQRATLEFRFVGEAPDAGADAGVDDGGGGPDAGCDTSQCTRGDCQVGDAGCGCMYPRAPAGTTCSAGVCTAAGACVVNPCEALAPGTACDDGRACTANSTCTGAMTCGGGTCSGTAPPCRRWNPASCANATTCDELPDSDLTSCATGLCLAGNCVKWIEGSPLNLRTAATDLPYPDAGWRLESPDGGPCDTVISTSTPLSITTSECGAPPIFSFVDDAGVAVFAMTSLTVGPGARLSFVGSRSAQLIVLGDAVINGTLSVAPIVAGAPAGSPAAACAAGPGVALKQAGGGGAFGGNGGAGGESGGLGGTGNGSVSPLRAGCPGAVGFAVDGGATPGGAGGGALELIVSDSFSLDGGIVTASGGGGAPGVNDGSGAGGGGSGGMVLIEAKVVNLNRGFVTANGGGGGEGGDTGQGSAPGALGPISSALAAPAADNGGSGGGVGGVGGAGASPNGAPGGNGGGGKGGGGGGGSVGVVFVRGSMSCTRGTGVLSGAQPMGISCNN